MDLCNRDGFSVSRYLHGRNPILYAPKDKPVQSNYFEVEKNDHEFDSVCILAVQFLEEIGAVEQTQWQIDEAKKIVRSMLRIMGREAKVFTLDEIKKNLIMAKNVISNKHAEYKGDLPQIKVVPCNSN